MIFDGAGVEYLLQTCRLAGDAILEVYGEDFEVETKRDQSPVTAADMRAHETILERLRGNWPEVPVLSEEAVGDAPYEKRKGWNRFWLVDPLDGTKEFVKRNGQFTVNIALIEDRHPTAGFVYAPVPQVMYYATAEGAFKASGGQVSRLPIVPAGADGTLRVVASLSHSNQETQDYLERARKQYDKVELVAMGSSLKICLVAEGAADVYPRFGPTMEWDTAAAHAVARGAGREIYQHGTRTPLEYNKQDLHNPWFLVE